MQLRSYQVNACDAALAFLRRSVEPCLIDAAPAAGKSYMIAHIAKALHDMSGGKRVLCLAPNAELVKQNFEKYMLTGERASIFSASAGAKSTRNFVVFGTPGTVKNAISRFCQPGQAGYCAAIVDEAHGLTPTIRDIIDAMREANPMLRVLGLTGTPYRLGSGYIFRLWPGDPARANGDDTARNPYFAQCVYRVSAREMLDGGFITPMTIGAINSGPYDTDGIVLLPNGTLQADTVERAFVGHGRKTAAIVADVIEQARLQPGGVMLFAATVRHAHEVLASLPPDNSAIVTGECGTADRRKAIKDYREGRVRYIVSVGTLTTGFDVAHTGTIALLRYTESAALLQQIMGRAWRMHPDKPDSLLLDYAGNVERHFPDGDIYNPDIRAGKAPGDGAPMDCHCPDCGHINEFTRHPDYLDYKHDRHGYALDTFGERIESEYGPIAVHYGRRCFGVMPTGSRGEYTRCNYRWTGKDCPHCGEKNDIAARFCYVCKGEIVDPNAVLQANFQQMKKDPTRPQTDKILAMTTKEGLSKSGNEVIRADFVTPYRQFSCWFLRNPKGQRQAQELAMFLDATKDEKPASVSYAKDASSGFYRVFAFNREPDMVPERIG